MGGTKINVPHYYQCRNCGESEGHIRAYKIKYGVKMDCQKPNKVHRYKLILMYPSKNPEIPK